MKLSKFEKAKKGLSYRTAVAAVRQDLTKETFNSPGGFGSKDNSHPGSLSSPSIYRGSKLHESKQPAQSRVKSLRDNVGRLAYLTKSSSSLTPERD
ncbi:hypothetical protein RRG08_046164 [Elysia crispata]|uniref:Uncharacterized protein n=1 Tax=Elysia crispata TaxID=231223 RepID=A0AAE1CJG1_9GAST|nr:hypothetical protein RRG08_046164 [Elysia crispata]